MTILTLFTIGWFSWFPIYVKRRFGILTSISAASYRLSGPKKYLYFTGWLAVLGILCILQILYTGGIVGVLFGLMGMGFAYAGVTVDHKSDNRSGEDEYHTYGTIMGVVSGFAILWITLPLWIAGLLSLIMASGMGALYISSRNWIWWTECLAMATIGIGLLLRAQYYV